MGKESTPRQYKAFGSSYNKNKIHNRSSLLLTKSFHFWSILQKGKKHIILVVLLVSQLVSQLGLWELQAFVLRGRSFALGLPTARRRRVAGGVKCARTEKRPTTRLTEFSGGIWFCDLATVLVWDSNPGMTCLLRANHKGFPIPPIQGSWPSDSSFRLPNSILSVCLPVPT